MSNIGPAANAWSPHFGFAYNVRPKTVLRGSYGLSSSALFGLAANGGNLPATGWSWNGSSQSLNNGITPAFNWSQTLGFPTAPPPLPTLDPAILNGSSPSTWYPNDIRPARTQNINAGIEQQLPWNLLVKVNYVGTMSHGLMTDSAIQENQLNPKYLALGDVLTEDITSPDAQNAGIVAPYPGFTGPVSQALLPFPQYLGISNILSHTGYSEYNSLQVIVQKHFGESLFFLVTYTNSKQLTNVGSFGGQGYAQTSGLLQENSEINTKTLGVLDRPQNLQLSYVYQLPFGSGKRFANTNNSFLKQVVAGWQISGFQQYTSGDPIAVTTEQAIPGNFGPIWADRVPGVPLVQTGCGSYDPGSTSQNRYLNLSAFIDPAPFTFGNTRVLPTVRNCPYYNENLSAQKMFKIRERGTLLFSADFNNLFNRHTWLGLQTNIDNAATFGQYTGASVPRLIQFHVKLEF